MNWRRILSAFSPTILGLSAAIWFNYSNVSNPIIYLKVDLGTLIFVGLLAFSVTIAISLLISDWINNMRNDLGQSATEDRRRFLHRLDHELKNPLTAIMAGLANLSTEKNNENKHLLLNSVSAQVLRLRDLVSNLRKISDLEFRQLERTPVDICELLKESVSLSEELFEKKLRPITLSIPHAPWPLPIISADRDLLALVVHNLIDNALKFTEIGDTIEIRAFENDNHIIIEVADTGPGIPESEISEVWEELYRGEAARGTPGSGLGLAIIRKIVHLHGGITTVRSRKGQGTVFSVNLPIENPD